MQQRLPEQAGDFIFGYTCVNDITAADILNRDPTFPQWARAKGIDGYNPFGPAIVTGGIRRRSSSAPFSTVQSVRTIPSPT